MRITVITAFPELIKGFLAWGIVSQSIKRGLLDIDCIDLRQYAGNKFGHIDDRPYGGGPGMVLRYEPLRDAILAAKQRLGDDACVCYLSPQGRAFDQGRAWRLSQARQGLVLLCGRYEGIDQRVIERWVDERISIGPYVLSGGEVAAAAVIEASVRLIPGVLGNEQSVEQESFSSWSRYDHPHYTRPEEVDGMPVPEVLLSGKHSAIEAWRKQRRKQAEEREARQSEGD